MLPCLPRLAFCIFSRISYFFLAELANYTQLIELNVFLSLMSKVAQETDKLTEMSFMFWCDLNKTNLTDVNCTWRD